MARGRWKPEWLGDIGDGWKPIVRPLVAKVLAEEGADIFQIKEKFGGLRVYAACSEQLQNEIDKAEQLSYTICEECGKPGKLTSNGYWLKTVCEYHMIDHNGRERHLVDQPAYKRWNNEKQEFEDYNP